MADKEWSRRSRINMYGASGTTVALGTTVLDMDGFESVLFIAHSSVTSTGNDIRVLNGTASTTGAGNFSEVFLPAGSSGITTGAQFVDVYRPAKRYVQALFETTASGTQKGLVAIRYGARALPTTQDVVTRGTQAYSPASGTSTATG